MDLDPKICPNLDLSPGQDPIWIRIRAISHRNIINFEKIVIKYLLFVENTFKNYKKILAHEEILNKNGEFLSFSSAFVPYF